MPSAKSGTPGSLVAPAEPQDALEADVADPGAVEESKARQRETQTGKYGAVQAQPHKPPATEEEKKARTSWIEIELVDEDNKPVPGEPYRITMPDGQTVAAGTLDHRGFARVDDIEPGTCKITFTDLDRDAWGPA